jgi:hypothetical protein
MDNLALVESLSLEVLDKILDYHERNFTTKGQKKRLGKGATHFEKCVAPGP